ncbi:DedA family protein [Tropicimonas sediminicola]|uniref:Membrane protein DedA, SNARE-associated domain n=1 Tax=Tropicimonas sediminicola TaxID=1031541 RepID=A0A239L1F0_9RHOB|nr:DedA family protein [Tropicimonas sediminicola]SNT24396.1 membrane protein DedA, SNARE-associated domain [Tropicimonas sediminicola]
MIDTLLALVPFYGLFLVGGVVAVSCLAVPLPSSMLVMASGGFAAAGDLVLWQVITVAFAGYVIGDQVAFHMARWGGAPLLGRMKTRPARAKLLERAEALVARWGAAAVLASRTIVSPLGPWTSYVSGAAGLGWRTFTLAAIPGAALWATAYAMLGFLFADQIADIATVIVDGAGLILAAAVAIGSGWWLWRGWRSYRLAAQVASEPLRNPR